MGGGIQGIFGLDYWTGLDRNWMGTFYNEERGNIIRSPHSQLGRALDIHNGVKRRGIH